MRMSQAMRIGASKTPKADGRLMDDGGGTCALGAMAVGAGFHPIFANGHFYYLFPRLVELTSCPVEGCTKAGPLGEIIPHLNNKPDCTISIKGHDWPREQIADWLEKEFETPKEIQEARDGHPPAVPAAEVMEFIGVPLPEMALVEK